MLKTTSRKAWLLPILLIALSTFASATPIAGSLPLAGFNAALFQGTDLADPNLIVTANPVVVSGAGTGNYAVIPALTSFGAMTLDINNLAAFLISNATYGTFDASGGVVVTQNPTFLNVVLAGIFTPEAGLGIGLDPTPSTLSLTITQTGTLSAALALESVPEPSTYALMGGGLLMLGLIRRRVQQKA